MFGGGGSQRSRGAQHLQTVVSIPFLDAIRGCSKDIEIDYTILDAAGKQKRVQKTLTVKVCTCLR
jgi:hypothetical protein